MPLWIIYHPVDAYTADDKCAFAKKITELYDMLPKFYVNVIFQEISKSFFYIGGEPVDNFVRLTMDHIARNIPEDRTLWWLEKVNAAIAPFVKDRGFKWELHVDETPFNLWSVQGYRPPPPHSEDEKRWARENTPSPITGA